MDIKRLFFDCSELFQATFKLFVQKEDEDVLKRELGKVREKIKELLNSSMIEDSVNLSKFLIAVKRGLDRAIEDPYEYFESDADLVNLVDVFSYVAQNSNLELTEEHYTRAYEHLNVAFPDILEEMATEEVQKEIPRDYEVSHPLESGADLKMRMFNQSEHAWTFRYYYHDREDEKWAENPNIINDLALFIRFKDGISDECKLSMHIIAPDKFMKEYLAEEAYSPHAKLYLEFIYEKISEGKESKYKLARVETVKGGQLHVIESKDVENALIKPIEFPFIVLDEIVWDFGEFKVPFDKKDGTESAFVFPENIRVVRGISGAKQIAHK